MPKFDLAQRYQLVYVLGSGHCGSTLLDLILNGHSQVFALGELVTLHMYIQLTEQAKGKLHHPRHFLQGELIDPVFNPLSSPFWLEVQHAYEKKTGRPFKDVDIAFPRWSARRKWHESDIVAWGERNAVLFSTVHDMSGAPILTDSSKVPARLDLLRRSGLFRIRVIHLVRDGRAVINSYIQKYGKFRGGFRRWNSPALASLYLRRHFRDDRWLQVRYEDLASRPGEYLPRICQFIGVSFEPEMLAFRTHPYLGIGGNRMRKEDSEAIRVDLAWKKELKSRHRLAFALLGGWLNKMWGYELF